MEMLKNVGNSNVLQGNAELLQEKIRNTPVDKSVETVNNFSCKSKNIRLWWQYTENAYGEKRTFLSDFKYKMKYAGFPPPFCRKILQP